MLKLYKKIIKTPSLIIDPSSDYLATDTFLVGEKLKIKINKMFGGSLAIREVDAGSSNACEQELTALGNSYYDVERFGVHFVASPRHADMLFITGAVSRNMAEAVKKTYEATPDPKIVVAIGDDAIDGGIFKGSYAVLDGVHNVIPVHFQIPGDPPSPKKVMTALLQILENIENGGNK